MEPSGEDVVEGLNQEGAECGKYLLLVIHSHLNNIIIITVCSVNKQITG